MAELPEIHSSTILPTSSEEHILKSLVVPEKLKEFTNRINSTTPSQSLLRSAFVGNEFPSKNLTINEHELNKVFTEGVKDIDQAQSLFLGGPLLAFVQGKPETLTH